MKESGYNPVLAVELSEIYAWTIDFFGLQKGDKYKIIYEEEFIDTISMGIRKIHAAWFQHQEQQFYAIPLIQDSTESYYDLEGNSLRKAFLKAPLRYSRISSRFSNSKNASCTKDKKTSSWSGLCSSYWNTGACYRRWAE